MFLEFILKEIVIVIHHVLVYRYYYTEQKVTGCDSFTTKGKQQHISHPISKCDLKNVI